MRLPSKQVLLRMYPTWDISKKKRMSALISVKHGQGFLRLLRSGSSKTKASLLQQRSPSPFHKGKRKLSPGGDDRTKKRFKVDTEQFPNGEVSSNISLQEGEKKMLEQEVRLTRSAAKLQGMGGASSTSTSSLQSGTESRPSRMGVVTQQPQHAHPKMSVDEKGILEDESTVSSSLGPQNELFQDNPKTLGEQASLSSSESTVTNGREAEVTVNVEEIGIAWRNKRKSQCPRKVLRKTDPDQVKCESVLGSCSQEEWLSQAGDIARSTSTEERNLPESNKEQLKVLEPEQEMLSRCIETSPARADSPLVMEPDEHSGQLSMLLDQDPMLAGGNLSCSSDLTMVPSSSQGDGEAVSFPGLRFQCIQDCSNKNNDMGEGFADVVDSSLIEETVQGDDLDNLLPGLSLLHVGRAAVEGVPQNEKEYSSHEKKGKFHKVKKHKSPHKSKMASSATQLDMPDDGGKSVIKGIFVVNQECHAQGKVDKTRKKSKFREHKHKSLHKSRKTKSTSPGKYTSSDQSSPLPKSPVFGRILPVSNWTSIESPVISPCRVELVDHLNSSQQKTPPKAGHEGNIGLQKGGSEIPHRVHQAYEIVTTFKEQVSIEDGCPGVQINRQSVGSSKELSEALNIPLHPSSPNESNVVAEVTTDKDKPDSNALEQQKSPSDQVDDQNRSVGYCLSPESSHSPKGQQGSDQPFGSPDADGKIDIPVAVKEEPKSSVLGKVKKSVGSRKTPRNSPRGAGGWEQSLRQRPPRVKLFQVARASKTPKKGALKVSPKKDTYSSVQKDSHTEMQVLPKPQEKSKDASPASSGAVKPRMKGWRKKTPREVAKPPPLDKDNADKHGASAKAKEKDEAAKYGSISRGQLVFGKMKGFCWWPGRIVHHYDRNIRDPPPPLTRWVQWFGDDKYSLLSLGQIAGFEDFPDYFSVSTFQKVTLYQKACYEALNVAAKRADKEFAVATPTPPSGPGTGIKERQEYKAKMLERFKVMQDWANDRFHPQGPDSIQPSEEDKQTPPVPKSPPPSPVRERKRSPLKHSSRNSLEKEPFEDKREERMKDVRAGKWTIEEICIGCGGTDLAVKHPLFVGGLCEVCRIEYLEVAYLYDVEGYQAHCCICAEGNQITLCDNQGCYHSYCTACMDYLVGPQESKKVSEQEPWSCYLCAADRCHGYLTRRDDWQEQLVEFFNRDRVLNFEPLRMYKPLLLADRRPIRVLSLFDGLGTGMLVLKELGFDVECYYASEVSEEAITVAAVRLKGQVKQVGDVQKITPKELKSWGPFDILIGGSPCNDLSIVNPARKGLEGGTGLLFFEFYRILRDLQPQPDDPRPFFWLFENVVFMGRKDKLNICRFLQCNPVMIDSRHMSPTHRARYYWGNLPGMHRPYIAGADNPLCLQECLEPHCDRQAQFSKVGTITTNSNSFRQTKDAILPVIMNGKEDGLWSTELERLFGFPGHYTDVGNLGRTARQKLLGKAWSVPVIKHLMAPLKDYFQCSGQNE